MLTESEPVVAPDTAGPGTPEQQAPDAGTSEQEAPEQQASEQQASEPAARPRWFDRARAAARYAAPAVGLYLLLRAVSMAVLYAMFAVHQNRRNPTIWFWDGTLASQRRPALSLLDLLLSWDGRWYTLLAADGYGPAHQLDPGGVKYDFRFAFFPLYPGVIRVVGWLPGLDVSHAALVVSLISSAAAAWGIFAIGNHLRGRRLGIVLAALWAVGPTCFAENAALTESLFTALSAWALYAVLRRRWVLAGSLTLLCGLSRPTAIALVATVGMAALVAVLRRRDGWRPYLAGLLAPLGYLGYLVFVGATYGGGITGFFTLQKKLYRSYFDFGRHTWKSLGDVVFVYPQADHELNLVAAFVVMTAVTLLILVAIQRVHWVLVLFAALLTVEALGSNAYMTSLPRHLLPAFPLFLPVAAVLGARLDSRRGRLAVAVTLAIAALLSGWYGGWLPLQSGQVI